MREYEELVKELREADEKSMCGECGMNLHNGTTKKGVLFAEAADAIEELSKPKWISVEERLTEEEKREYWCYTDAGVMCECRWTNNKYGLGASDKWGWNIMDVPQYQKVTHWMPLPEPPKEDKP